MTEPFSDDEVQIEAPIPEAWRPSLVEQVRMIEEEAARYEAMADARGVRSRRTETLRTAVRTLDFLILEPERFCAYVMSQVKTKNWKPWERPK